MTSTTPRTTPAAKAAPLDLAAIASRAVVVKALPKPQRKPSGTDALSGLVKASYNDRMVFELPAVAVPDGVNPAKLTATLVAAVRRAAALANLGVSVHSEVTPKGVVVTFKGKRKSGK